MMSRLGITKELLSRLILGKPEGKTVWQKMTEKEPERLDVGFPLNLRIFSRVNLNLTDYLLAEKKLAMARPTERGTVAAIGTIRHDRDGLQDYLARIIPDEAKENEAMQLLYVETQNGQVLDTKLFMRAAEIYPETADEWGQWLDEGKGIIGLEILDSPDGNQYERQWGDGIWVPPMETSERVLGDRYGKQVSTNGLKQMLYGRELMDDAGNKLTTEYALVSVVNDSFIEILLGVPITITADSIIGA